MWPLGERSSSLSSVIIFYAVCAALPESDEASSASGNEACHLKDVNQFKSFPDFSHCEDNQRILGLPNFKLSEFVFRIRYMYVSASICFEMGGASLQFVLTDNNSASSTNRLLRSHVMDLNTRSPVKRCSQVLETTKACTSTRSTSSQLCFMPPRIP